MVERSEVVGGHSRCEVLNGVVYEPNGAHIFHTSNRTVAEYVQRFGMTRPYEHRVLTEVYLRPDDDEPRLLSWPPQVDELRELPDWARIERELAELPSEPSGDDFETLVVSLMGRHLYDLFIEDYTRKQWGCEPSELSSRFAPKRVDLRDDGYTRLFRDTWEFFPPTGATDVIEAMLSTVPVTCGIDVGIDDVPSVVGRPDAVVITAPLDDLLGRPGELAWRGIHMVSRYVPTDDPSATITPAYVVNRPSLRVPYTRTVETKHASGQQIRGTVVSEEHPGAPSRHYPVPTVDGRYEAINGALQQEVRDRLDGIDVHFCGRLSTYSYIDQDQAIGRALDCADRGPGTCPSRDRTRLVSSTDRPAVAIAIPAYNESEGIAEFLTEIDQALRASDVDVVMVIVDDCSTDDTIDFVNAVAPSLSADVITERTASNSGHGPTALAAYRRALDTGADYIVGVDGDGQFLGSDIRRVLVLLQDGGDGVCGVRRFRYDPWFRMLLTARAADLHLHGVRRPHA